MRDVLALVVLILFPSLAWADPSTPTSLPATPVLSPGIVPIGSLGFPLGTYLTLEGTRAEGFKTGVQTLLVDTINGKRLDKPVGIWVDNRDLPPKCRCAVKGYETIRMLGTPPAVIQAAKETGKDVSLEQAGWQVHLYFVALTDVTRTETDLKSDPVGAIRSVLPEGWTILKVEENTYPHRGLKGNGKAVFLFSPEQRLLPKQSKASIVYVMPANYQYGEDPTPEAATYRAALILTTPTAKVYLRGNVTPFSATGWPTLKADILKALSK